MLKHHFFLWAACLLQPFVSIRVYSWFLIPLLKSYHGLRNSLQYTTKNAYGPF